MPSDHHLVTEPHWHPYWPDHPGEVIDNGYAGLVHLHRLSFHVFA